MGLMETVQSLQTLNVYRSDVNTVDFAGDCVLVTGSGDKKVRVFEWRLGVGYSEVSYSPLMGHKYGVTCVKVSPQSTMLASSSIDGTTQLWNLWTGSKIHTMVQVGGEAVRVCRFSPDSTLLITADDSGQVCLWDLVRRTLARSFQKHENAVQGVCFSPDSSWLITTCTFGVLNLFSTSELSDSCLTDNQLITTFASVDDAHDLGVISCDCSVFQEQIASSDRPFSKLYQLATCGNDHCVKLWDIVIMQDNKCDSLAATAQITLRRVLERHSSALTCVRFSSNGFYLASCGLDKTTVIWETHTGRIAAALVGHSRYVASCAFSRDGNLLATGSNDRSVIIWDLTGNFTLDSELTRHCSRKSHWIERTENTLQEEVFVEEAENSTDSEVKILQILDEHAGAVNSVAVFGNNMIASASSDKSVRIWLADEEMENNDEVEKKFQEVSYSPLDAHKYSVNYVEFSPCGKMLASCSLDGSTIIWDTETGTQAKASFVNSGSAIRICRWSPNGTKIATAGDDEKTTLWDLEKMEELRVFKGHADAITAIAFTHDSRYIVTACSEGAWRIFDTLDTSDESNALLICDVAHDLGVQGCDFSPSPLGVYPTSGSKHCSFDDSNNYLLATCGNDSLVKLWHVCILNDDCDKANKSEETEQEETEKSSNSNYGVNFYNEKRSLNGHGGNVTNVRFSPEHGEILGSVATDRTARIWSVHSGVCLHVLENHESLVTACAFSKDTSLFVTGALDKTILVWRISQQLVSQSTLIDRLRNNRKKVSEWKSNDIAKWMNEIGLPNLAKFIEGSCLNGKHLLSLSEDELVSRFGIDEDEAMVKSFKRQLYWLKRENTTQIENIDDINIPHEYLCPITHEVMREPVRCSDGFVYEKAAINEWFLCGKFRSPMTNEPLRDTTFTPAVALRNAICALIHGERPES